MVSGSVSKLRSIRCPNRIDASVIGRPPPADASGSIEKFSQVEGGRVHRCLRRHTITRSSVPNSADS